MNRNSFATIPLPILFLVAALFGFGGFYNLRAGMAQHSPVELVDAAGTLILAGFLVYCLVQRLTGRGQVLASPRVTRIGNVCIGLFAAAFLAKIFGTGFRVFG